MHPEQPSVLSPREVARLLVVHRRRWLVPAALLGLAALAYAILHAPTWEASQALAVRNEVSDGQPGLGKFSSDEMKTVQETILELVKSRGVLSAALTAVGPPADYRRDKAAWPTARDVERLRKDIELVPPKGAEFGKTEVFYLKVQANDKARAVTLATVISEELKTRFQQLLDDRAASIIGELHHTVALAEADLKGCSDRLSALERGVGGDLAELRILQALPAGGSDLRQKAVALDNELREANTDRRAKAELLSLLQAASNDPSRLEALPSRLLESHASLRRLSEGLSTAQLNTSTLLGKMSEAHPLVQAAKIEEQEVLRNLRGELANAIQISEVELRLADARAETLEAQLVDVQARLDRLAGLRTQYAALVAETQNRTELLETARRGLADARASQAAARTASLIAQIDLPDTGSRPTGPSRSMIVLLGIAGGLATGFGLVFLTVPATQPTLAPQPAEHVSSPVATVRSNGHATSSNGRDASSIGHASPSNGHAAPPATVPSTGRPLRRALEKIACQNRA